MRSVGRMRERVLVYNPGRVSDGALGFNRQDNVIAEAWARIQPVSSREIFRYQHLEQEITHKVTMRHNKDIRQGQHLRWVKTSGTLELYIEVVTPVGERNEFIEVICRLGGNL